MTSHFVTVLNDRVHYRSFGERRCGDNNNKQPVIVCVHGMLRCCRDFDTPAAALAASLPDGYIIAVDVVGRGLSSWSQNPSEEYQRDHYARWMGVFLETVLGGPVVGEDRILFDFIGTSMGGLIAMAGVHHGYFQPRRVVLNDIGPEIDTDPLLKIIQSTMKPPVCDTYQELEERLAVQYRPFGYDLTAEQMHSLLDPCIREKEIPISSYEGDDASSSSGTTKKIFTVHWDPDIVKGLRPPPPGSATGWDLFLSLIQRTEVLVLRGEDSDVLTQRILGEMYEKGKALLKGEEPFVGFEIKLAGHAPALMSETEIGILKDFFLKSPKALATSF